MDPSTRHKIHTIRYTDGNKIHTIRYTDGNKTHTIRYTDGNKIHTIRYTDGNKTHKNISLKNVTAHTIYLESLYSSIIKTNVSIHNSVTLYSL